MPFVGKHKSLPESFSWDEYLRHTEETPAPKGCFKQAEKPPENLYEIGMKLESRDPRNDRSFSVATVIYTQGPRLRLRLDGSDNRNDFWSLVDSVDIHEVGWCESQGDLLQPPLGFSKNASFWPTFLSKLLNENKDKFSPKKCFMLEPPSPPKNLFQVGMKLEAIDKKNPHIIGPATVGEVVGDKILVTFDGWRGASDFWCRYDSREIFPVGWCASVGHYLQHPGTKGSIGRGKSTSSTKSPSLSPHVPMHIDTTSAGAVSPSSSPPSGSRKHSPTAPITPGNAAQPSPILLSPGTTLSPGHATDLHTTDITVTAYVNQTCVGGPLLNETKLIRLPLQFGPGPIQRIARKLVQAMLDSANNPLEVFRLVIPGESSSAVTAKNDKTNSVNLPQFNTDLALHNYMKNLLRGVECCKNLITFQPLARICKYCQAGTSGAQQQSPTEYNVAYRSLSAPAGLVDPPTRRRPGRPPGRRGRRKSRPVGNVESSRRHPYVRSELLERRTSGNEMTQLHVSTNTNEDSILQIATSNNSGYLVPRPYASHRIPSMNPLDWTHLDVISYVKAVDPGLAKYAHLFVTHEIDGRAFLLITSDVAIKYMKMKVGPAVKLCSLVDRLKMSL